MKKVLIAGLFLALTNVAMASTEDEMTSLSYISYLERYATILPANQDESLEAAINMPLVAGDRVDTAREARMEVILADGNTVWLDEYTTLSFDAVAFSRDAEAERTVIFLAEGTIMVEISEFALSSKPMRIDSRGATVYLGERGLYRLRALPTGGLTVEVVEGLAEAATTAGGVLVREETSVEVEGGEIRPAAFQFTWDDADFAAWVEMRRQVAAGESSQHVDLRYSRQAAQLDNYGGWIYVDSIDSWAWQPSVGGDWQPYRAGRWYWTSTGYAWISYEPWGWLPYHYGSWYHDVGFGWVWSWGRNWGPAWVSWMWWPGYVGWCPYGYYNSWYWNSYGGYYPPYRPGYPGDGGGHYQPPRRDVMPPPRNASGRMGADSTLSRIASGRAIDINGTVRMASVDRRGWTVVSQDDFTSPNISRLARSGDRLIPTAGDQTGVVMSGPLTTRSPRIANPGTEIERVFRDVESRATADVSPLMARDSSLSADAVRQLGRQTNFTDLSRPRTDGVQSTRQTVAPRLSAGAGSPFVSSSGARTVRPNLYRPTMYSGRSDAFSGATGSTSSSGGSRQLLAPRTSSGRAGTRSPVIVPRSTSSSVSRGSSPSRSSAGTRGPSSRSSSSVRSSPSRSSAPQSRSVSGSRSSGSSSRSSAGSSRSSGGSTSSGSSSTKSSSGRRR